MYLIDLTFVKWNYQTNAKTNLIMRGAGLPIAGSLQGASVSICTNIFAGPLQGA